MTSLFVPTSAFSGAYAEMKQTPIINTLHEGKHNYNYYTYSMLRDLAERLEDKLQLDFLKQRYFFI